MRILHIVHYNAENKLAFIEILFSFLCTFFFFLSIFRSPRAILLQYASVFSYPLWTFSFLDTFNQLTERHLFAFIIYALYSIQKEKHSNFNGECYCIFEFVCHCYMWPFRYTFKKKRDNNEKISTLHIRTVILFIDRKSRHINRMNNIQMEIDIFSNSIEITVTFSFHLFSLVAVAVVLFIGWCTRKSQAGLKWRNIATINKQVESKQN